MKEPIQLRAAGASGQSAADALATLRAVAKLPAAAELEKRVKAALVQPMRLGLATVDDEQSGRGGWMHSAAMRGLAAAAIVLIVVGGGWGVARYGRRTAPPQAVGFPRVTPGGDFSNAGAMRTPRTLTPPAAPKQKHTARRAKNPSSMKPQAGKRAKPIAKAKPDGSTPGSGAPER